MGPLDVVWHVGNLLLPALALAALTAGVAKLLWRRELAGVAWVRLAGWSALANACTVCAGLAVFGVDGRTATYAAMVLVCTVTLWWLAFGPGRR